MINPIVVVTTLMLTAGAIAAGLLGGLIAWVILGPFVFVLVPLTVFIIVWKGAKRGV